MAVRFLREKLIDDDDILGLSILLIREREEWREEERGERERNINLVVLLTYASIGCFLYVP